MFVFKDKQQYHPEAHMKNGTKRDCLPPLISDVITDSKHYIDNLFADTWKKLKLNTLIRARRLHQAKRYRDNRSSLSLAAVEMVKCVIDSDVFQKSLGAVFSGEKRCDV